MFTTGQEVWCLIYGHGVITEVDNKRFEDTYPVLAKFQKNDDLIISYTADGRFHNQGNVTLFPYPVEIVKAVTKPSIEWSHVNARFRYLAMDAEGKYHIYADKPLQCDQQWIANQPCTPAIHFASFVPGTCDWKDSLVKRPEGDSRDD